MWFLSESLILFSILTFCCRQRRLISVFALVKLGMLNICMKKIKVRCMEFYQDNIIPIFIKDLFKIEICTCLKHVVKYSCLWPQKNMRGKFKMASSLMSKWDQFCIIYKLVTISFRLINKSHNLIKRFINLVGRNAFIYCGD